MKCNYCNGDIQQDQQWIGLNRIALGRGKKPCLLEFHGKERSGYRWDIDHLQASGCVLCWPHCAMSWLEGELIEHDWVK